MQNRMVVKTPLEATLLVVGFFAIGASLSHVEADEMNSLKGDVQYLDRFNYNETVQREDGFVDYGPSDWDEIECDEAFSLDSCLAYTDKWKTGREWSIQKNYCRSCPQDDPDSCGERHHQSPINLQRAVGLDPDMDELANECIDVHWMKYEDSSCSLEDLVDAGAFTIERHALRISQPVDVYEDFREDLDGLPDGVRLKCRKEGIGSRFGRIDFSKGFSQWWFLSHTDIHTPSEHTQEGVRYDAEIQLHHFYSVTGREAGIDNQVATVSIFANAYDDVAPYPFLDKVICQWRRKEYEVRKECGLPPIAERYPGCFPLTRDRNLRKQEATTTNNNNNNETTNFQTVHDVILHNDFHRDHPNNETQRLVMEDTNWEPSAEKDWDAWIRDQSDRMTRDEELYHSLRNGGEHTERVHADFHRALFQYEEIEWFNYWPMLGVRTEYYFRYSGSQTIPPCYGNFQQESRKGTNHWRVMKDPLRIHTRQLVELRRLLGDRIAPLNSKVNACNRDTASKVEYDDVGKISHVDNARPLQYWAKPHFKTFCECKDWPSKWPEDQRWCLIEDMYERFYDKPYNFGW